MVNPKQMESIYTSGAYSTDHPSYHTEDSAWKAQQVMAMLGRHSLTPNTVCEVGCGAGEILRQVQTSLGTEGVFHGFDISPQAISLSQQRSNKGLEFFCADFLSTPTQTYNLLLCMDVVEHVDDYIGFLRKLRPRADYKLFHFPLDLSAQAVFRQAPLLTKRRKRGHIHYFTKDTALETLGYAGYETVDWNYTGSGVYKNQTLLNWLAKYPRLILFGLCPDLVVRALGGYSLLVLTK